MGVRSPSAPASPTTQPMPPPTRLEKAKPRSFLLSPLRSCLSDLRRLVEGAVADLLGLRDLSAALVLLLFGLAVLLLLDSVALPESRLTVSRLTQPDPGPGPGPGPVPWSRSRVRCALVVLLASWSLLCLAGLAVAGAFYWHNVRLVLNCQPRWAGKGALWGLWRFLCIIRPLELAWCFATGRWSSPGASPPSSPGASPQVRIPTSLWNSRVCCARLTRVPLPRPSEARCGTDH